MIKKIFLTIILTIILFLPIKVFAYSDITVLPSSSWADNTGFKFQNNVSLTSSWINTHYNNWHNVALSNLNGTTKKYYLILFNHNNQISYTTTSATTHIYYFSEDNLVNLRYSLATSYLSESGHDIYRLTHKLNVTSGYFYRQFTTYTNSTDNDSFSSVSALNNDNFTNNFIDTSNAYVPVGLFIDTNLPNSYLEELNITKIPNLLGYIDDTNLILNTTSFVNDDEIDYSNNFTNNFSQFGILFQFNDNVNSSDGFYLGTANNITYSTGKYGNGAVFNGTSSYVQYSNVPIFRPTADFEVSAYVKSNANTGLAKSIFSSFYIDESNKISGFDFRIGGNNVLSVITAKNTGSVLNTDYSLLNGTTNLIDNNWHYVKFSYISGVGYLYVDGVQEATGAMMSPVYNTSNYVVGGTRRSSPSMFTNYMNGMIDNLVFSVFDSTSPVITLNGSSTVNLQVGATYSDLGATASDNLEGDVTSRIVVTSNVNPNVEGDYYVRYRVCDSSNNCTVLDREVIVTDVYQSISMKDKEYILIYPKSYVGLPVTDTIFYKGNYTSQNYYVDTLQASSYSVFDLPTNKFMSVGDYQEGSYDWEFSYYENPTTHEFTCYGLYLLNNDLKYDGYIKINTTLYNYCVASECESALIDTILPNGQPHDEIPINPPQDIDFNNVHDVFNTLTTSLLSFLAPIGYVFTLFGSFYTSIPIVVQSFIVISIGLTSLYYIIKIISH